MSGFMLDDKEKNKILKLIGIIDAMKMMMKPVTLVVDYNDCNCNQKLTTMTPEEVENFIEKVWSDLQ